MARRELARGALVYQQGKKLEGEFYIIAVFDDPLTCTLSFCAYELENDCTFTLAFTYSEFDDRFVYDRELSNPVNTDARFNWVCERLDFVLDGQGQKYLVLANEPTPDEDKLDADGLPSGGSGGKLDASARAELLRSKVDDGADERIFHQLVKSEDARRGFLADLNGKRLLEQLKASQRLYKADEDREARLAKLEIIRREQEARAEAAKASESAKKGTYKQLENLMKQKEAQNILKLLKVREEQDKGVGRERDAAKQRRKAQEKNYLESKSLEQQKANNLGLRRAENESEFDQKLVRANRDIAFSAQQDNDLARAKEMKKQEDYRQLMSAFWAFKDEVRKARRTKEQIFGDLESIRERNYLKREKQRALKELAGILALRADKQLVEKLNRERQSKAHKDWLLQWKIRLANEAIGQRNQQERNARRSQRIEDREEARLRKFRESQFLDTMRSTRSLSPTRKPEADEALGRAGSLPPALIVTLKDANGEGFHQTYQDSSRARAERERAQRRKQEEQKLSKLKQLSSKDHGPSEVKRIRQWRLEVEIKKKVLAEAMEKREIQQEEQAASNAKQIQERHERWNELEERRRQQSAERRRQRIGAAVAQSKAVALGSALPDFLGVL